MEMERAHCKKWHFAHTGIRTPTFKLRLVPKVVVRGWCHRVFGGLYHCVKFGCISISRFHNKSLNILSASLENAYSRPFWGKNGKKRKLSTFLSL